MKKEYSNQFPIGKNPNAPKRFRASVGKLWYNGECLIYNKPFGVLQQEKKALISVGYKKELFKITY